MLWVSTDEPQKSDHLKDNLFYSLEFYWLTVKPQKSSFSLNYFSGILMLPYF